MVQVEQRILWFFSFEDGQLIFEIKFSEKYQIKSLIFLFRETGHFLQRDKNSLFLIYVFVKICLLCYEKSVNILEIKYCCEGCNFLYYNIRLVLILSQSQGSSSI